MIQGSCLCGTVKWRFDSEPEGATACNCSACRRYGALWIYGYAGEDVHSEGPTEAFRRGKANLGFHFCAKCGNVAYWLATSADKDGRKRMAVNLRLAEKPEQIERIPIDHFDGFGAFEDLPRDGKCVKDMWF